MDEMNGQLPVPPGLTRDQLIERGDTAGLNLADSLGVNAADTVPPVWGVVIEVPRPVPEVKPQDTSISWLFVALLVCFVTVAVRFKNNGKYVLSLWKDITEVRERRNVFDDTVRETSFLVLLNVLWIATASVLFGCLLIMTSGDAAGRFSFLSLLPGSAPKDLPMMTLTGAFPVVVVYTLLMFFGYWLVGNVFSDEPLTRMWLRGFAATNGILSVFLFPLALLVLCYPMKTAEMLLTAGIFFILAKILFLYKGFRIFFSQGSSWVLFLYYLCSLEIVPLVLAYTGGMISARIW